jgi:hypothetical protein
MQWQLLQHDDVNKALFEYKNATGACKAAQQAHQPMHACTHADSVTRYKPRKPFMMINATQIQKQHARRGSTHTITKVAGLLTAVNVHPKQSLCMHATVDDGSSVQPHPKKHTKPHMPGAVNVHPNDCHLGMQACHSRWLCCIQNQHQATFTSTFNGQKSERHSRWLRPQHTDRTEKEQQQGHEVTPAVQSGAVLQT